MSTPLREKIGPLGMTGPLEGAAPPGKAGPLEGAG